MKQCPCGKYYLERDTVCPFCGYKLSKAEWKEHLKELKVQRKEEKRQKVREDNAAFMARAKEKQEQGKLDFEKKKAEMNAVFAADKKRKADDKRAVSAVLIGTAGGKSAVGTAGRAVVGGALLGPIGAIAGAASGKSKTTRATFSVKYASGRTGTETVDIGTKRFNELSALLHK